MIIQCNFFQAFIFAFIFDFKMYDIILFFDVNCDTIVY